MAGLHEAIFRDFSKTHPDSVSSANSALDGGEYDIDEILTLSQEADPMQECMGAPTQEAPMMRASLPREQEEFMLATVEKTFRPESYGDGVVVPGRQSLETVKAILNQFWESGSYLFPKTLSAVINAPKDARTYALLGEAGIVDFFVGVLSTNDVLDEIVVQVLQLIGECCEKIDANKLRIVSQRGILPILYKLWNPSLVPIAISVLCQICAGNEAAQQQAADLHTARILVDLLSRTDPPGGGALTVLVPICRLLVLMLNKRPEGYSDATAYVLFQLAIDNESKASAYCHLISTAIAWLQLKRVRLHFVEVNNAKLLQQILETSYLLSPLPLRRDSRKRSEGDLSNDLSLQQRLRIAVIDVLTAVSAEPQFSSQYTLESRFVATLQEWLLMANPQLQACACVVLANMANTDVNRIVMLHRFQVHEVLLPLIESSSSAHLRASSAYFLKAILASEACQRFLSNRPVIRAASHLWGITNSPHLQYMGVALTHQAIKGSYPMLRQLLDPLSLDPDSPAHSKTFLSLLLRLWQDYYGYRQHERLTSEVTWTVVSVCNMLWSLNPLGQGPEIAQLQTRLISQHLEIANPLITLLVEDKQPVARSKALFTMALLARDSQGAIIVHDMVEAAEVFNFLSVLVSPAQLLNGGEEDQIRTKYDKRNALILMGCMQKHKDPFGRKPRIDMILKSVPDVDIDNLSREYPIDSDGDQA